MIGPQTRGYFIFNLSVITTLLMVLELPTGCRALTCYICESKESNFLCMSDFKLHRCEDTNFDTCQTIVAYSDVSEKLSVTKSCTTNSSCIKQQIGTPETPCVLTNPVWTCTYCCHSDGCNLSNASRTSPLWLISISGAILILLYL